MTKPEFDLKKIKYTVDKPTYQRALDLYKKGKVKDFRFDGIRYSATVIGTEPYRVSLSTKKYDEGYCNCYLGQQDILCKHLVATALYALFEGREVSKEDEELNTEPKSSGKIGEMSQEKLKDCKRKISKATRYIKPYNGPSSTWFRYQNSLEEGCSKLSEIIYELPINPKTCELLVDLLIKLDKKLVHDGVDDSDGTVGDFIELVVNNVLMDYAEKDKNCVPKFQKLVGLETCFGWEEDLIKLLEK